VTIILGGDSKEPSKTTNNKKIASRCRADFFLRATINMPKAEVFC